MMFVPEHCEGKCSFIHKKVPCTSSARCASRHIDRLIYGCNPLNFIASPSVQSATAKCFIFCSVLLYLKNMITLDERVKFHILYMVFNDL